MDPMPGHDAAAMRRVPSTPCGGSSRPGSSPGWPATSATSAWARTWPTTRWPPRSSSGPRSGVPDNPGAWLMAVGKRRAVDLLRRRTVLERKHEELGRELEARSDRRRSSRPRELVEPDDDFGDDLLRLIFVACHPVLSTEARVALTLRLLGGLTTDEIARAFLVREPTVAQRIVRAKRTLAEAKVPFEVPEGAERARPAGVGARSALSRLQRGVLGHRRRRLDAPRPVRGRPAPGPRSWPSSCPTSPRSTAWWRSWRSRRRGSGPASVPSGEPVLLLDQDRSRWDQVLIRRGLAALDRAEQLGRGFGPYALQAAIAACHARARTAAGDRLGAHRGALRRAGPAGAVARRRAQPRRGVLHGVRPRGRRSSSSTAARRGAGAARIPPPAERAR